MSGKVSDESKEEAVRLFIDNNLERSPKERRDRFKYNLLRYFGEKSLFFNKNTIDEFLKFHEEDPAEYFSNNGLTKELFTELVKELIEESKQ
jgi:hypothetical protein